MELGVPCRWVCQRVGSEAGAGHRCGGVFVTWALDFSSSRPCRLINDLYAGKPHMVAFFF